MNIKNKYKSTIILLIISLILVLFNYIAVNKYLKVFLNKDITNYNKINNENADKLKINDIKNMTYPKQLDLARTYYARREFAKSVEICEIILNYSPTDSETIYLISAIYQNELDYNKSLSYLERLLPLSHGIDLYNLCVTLSNHYLLSDIDKSLEFLNRALNLKNEQEFILSENEISYVESKRNYFLQLKNLKNNTDSFEFYKSILDSTFFDTSLKEYTLENYKNLYSSQYPANFNTLSNIFQSEK